jgi:hypothetical protein
VVADTRELDLVLELGVAEDLARDRVLARVLDDDLRLAVAVLFDRDDAGGEAGCELGLVGGGDGGAQDDVREETVRCGR